MGTVPAIVHLGRAGSDNRCHRRLGLGYCWPLLAPRHPLLYREEEKPALGSSEGLQVKTIGSYEPPGVFWAVPCLPIRERYVVCFSMPVQT